MQSKEQVSLNLKREEEENDSLKRALAAKKKIVEECVTKMKSKMDKWENIKKVRKEKLEETVRVGGNCKAVTMWNK